MVRSDKITNGIINYYGKIEKAEKGKLPARVARKAMDQFNCWFLVSGFYLRAEG